VNIQPGKWLVVKDRMPHSADTFEVGRTSLEYIFHPTYTSWFVTHNDVYAVFDTRSQARPLPTGSTPSGPKSSRQNVVSKTWCGSIGDEC